MSDPMFIVIDGIGGGNDPQTTNVGRTYPLHSGVVLGRNSIRHHTPVVGAAQETPPVYLTTYASEDFSFTGYINANWLRVSSGEALIIRDSGTPSDVSSSRLLQRLNTNDCTVSYLQTNNAFKLTHGDIIILKQTDEMLIPPSNPNERQQITQGLRAFVFVLTTADPEEAIKEEHVASFRQNLSTFLRCVRCSFTTEETPGRYLTELSTSENDERLRAVRAEILIQGLHHRLGASSWIGAIFPDNVHRIVALL